MANNTYPWQRLWCKAEGKYHLDAYGFAEPLTSSNSPWRFNDDVYGLEQLSNIPCLILLGEPGIGKSFAVEEAINECSRNGNACISISATACTSLDNLRQKIFGSHEWQQWLQGTSSLHVFIDSLDEGRLFFEGVIDEVLLDELSNCRQHRNLDQLYFRVVCRRADWSAKDTQSLKDIWGKSAVEAYELIPLTRSDVESAANSSGLDGPSFLKELIEHEIVPLATRPVTLNMILADYQDRGDLPASRREAYENGCRLLARESSRPRAKKGKQGQFCEAHRLAVASLIAATMLLGRKPYVSLGNTRDESTFDARELVGTTAEVNGAEFSITRDAIQETLGSALFSGGLPEDSLTWTHHTFAEYLAACCLLRCISTPERALQLLSTRVLGTTKLVPEFHELVAWIATIDKAMLNLLIQTEPLVLLRSDSAVFGNEERTQLVEGLLLAAEHSELRDMFSIRQYFHKLRHPQLAVKLRRHLGDSTAHTDLRLIALEIAEACDVEELVDDLFQLALCSREDPYVRRYAVAAISELVHDARLERLAPLIETSTLEDPNDELRGCALRSLWPKYLPAVEMFGSLRLPRNKSYTGSYVMFLKHELAEGLDVTSTPMALRFARAFSAALGRHTLTSLQDVVSAIAVRALEYTESPEVLEELAALFCTYGHRYGHPFDQGYGEPVRRKAYESWLLEDDSRRRMLLLHVYDSVIGAPLEEYYFVERLVLRSDFSFAVKHFSAAAESRSRRFWAYCLKYTFDVSLSHQIQELMRLLADSPELQSLFRAHFATIELGSEQAERMRLAHDEQTGRLKCPPPDCPTDATIEEFLLLLQSGDFGGWAWLCDKFTVGFEHDERIVARKAWASLSAFLKARFAEASIGFLASQDPKTTAWRETDQLPLIALAGFECLTIIQAVDEGLLDELDDACWKRWCPTLIQIGMLSGYGDLMERLLPVAYRRAPAEYLESIEFGLSGRLDSDPGWYVEWVAYPVWGAQISAKLVEIAQSEDAHPDALRAVFKGLMQRQPVECIAIANQIVVCFGEGRYGEEQALEASLLLLREGVSASWPIVWPFISDECDRLREVLVRLGSPLSSRPESGLARLAVQNRAQFYRAALQLFPSQTSNGDNSEMRTIPRDDPESIKSFFLDTLMFDPTEQTCVELQAIVQDFPECPWLKSRLNELIILVRGTNWQPIAPGHFLEYVRDQNRRFVRNADELVDAVVDSIARLEYELLNSNLGRKPLWLSDVSKSSRPQEETYLSSFLCDFFQRDLASSGVVSSCEVTIRHSKRSTDLLLTAFMRERGNPVRSTFDVVVEVKGSWHRKALDIKSELVDRYLTSTARTHGIFVLFFFNQDLWDSSDYRRDNSRRNCGDGIDALRSRVEAAAKELCRDSLVVRGVVIDASLLK